ncbi:MAG TPA: hypothetical protein VFU15_04975 [Bacteroidia bacterium]|nr:hypothetical protein [Bacteroidia bacterium]
MKKLIVLLSIFIPLFFFIACRHEPVLPDEQVSFTAQVQPIIRGSCQHSGCHDTLSTSQDHRVIDSYEDMMADNRIVPGKPHSSQIYIDITASSGEDMMPTVAYPRLTSEQIKLIYIWILQGAKNN